MTSNKKKTYAVINFITLSLVIFWNYWANSSTINGNTVGELSDKYNSLFTPPGYAFALWGVIFLGLFVHTLYQLKCAFTVTDDNFIEKIGPWFSVANLANGAWIWFWLNEYTGLSVLVMIILMLSLITIIIKLNMERWYAPKTTIAFIWWPISIYSGWIAVALIANVSSYLVKIQWSTFLSAITWAVVMIVVATLLNIFMIYTRIMREFALVGVWSFVAIAVRHWDTIPTIQWTAVACASLLFIIITIHEYQNRLSNPFIKS